MSWHPSLAATAIAAAAALCLMLPEVLPPYITSRDVLQPPGPAHWLGTNDIGQDVLTGLLRATPNTVLIALLTAAAALVLSILFAGLTVTGPRWLQRTLMRVVDVLQIVPSVLVILLVAAWVQPDLGGIALLLALTIWPDDVRVLRTVFRRELIRENVAVARRLGGSWAYCLGRHVLPAIAPVLVGLFLQHVRQAALKTAGLGFLGLTDPRLVTWGGMMQDALDYLHTSAWIWLLVPPAACLTLFLHGVLRAGGQLEHAGQTVKAGLT
ncbi:ABC transporter permease [Pannonibacter sp.]|uniref:ABC transporter permease n=1 Tax=Pannonibacter sp. TaxID=1906786 RepID=UPI003F6FE05E